MGGGGRYDKMVGRFTGNDVPACGFSIGFERIILLLLESGFKIPGQAAKKAYLIEKGYPGRQAAGGNCTGSEGTFRRNPGISGSYE